MISVSCKAFYLKKIADALQWAYFPLTVAKKRTSISINERLHDAALRVMLSRNFDEFSEYVESLVRADVERQQQSGSRIAEEAASYGEKKKTA